MVEKITMTLKNLPWKKSEDFRDKYAEVVAVLSSDFRFWCF